MSIQENDTFHILNKRPRPLTGAIGAIVTLIGLIKWFQQHDDSLLVIAAIITELTIIQW
jgi:cytochrome c oxidase subunit 3